MLLAMHGAAKPLILHLKLAAGLFSGGPILNCSKSQQPNYLAEKLFLYLRISEMVPAPTVRPPSRMAKRRPFSMATAVGRVLSRWMFSHAIPLSVASRSLAD